MFLASLCFFVLDQGPVCPNLELWAKSALQANLCGSLYHHSKRSSDMVVERPHKPLHTLGKIKHGSEYFCFGPWPDQYCLSEHKHLDITSLLLKLLILLCWLLISYIIREKLILKRVIPAGWAEAAMFYTMWLSIP